MADMLKTGLAWLTDQLASHASQSVIYARGGRRTTVRATFGEKLLKLSDDMGGVRMQWTDIDFLIPASDLVFSGERFEPERDDQIYVRDVDDDGNPSGPTRIYQVAPYGDEPPWRYTDPHRSQVRTHAKFVEEEPLA